MILNAVRSKALDDIVQTVDRLHQVVLATGSDSDETGAAADKASKALATAKYYGITATDIARATRTP